MVDLKDYICEHCGTTPHSKECKRLHKIQHRFLDACHKLEYDGVRIVALLQRLIQLVDSGSIADPLTDEEISCARKLAEKLREEKGDPSNDKKRSDSYWIADLCPCCMLPWTWWCEHCGAQEGLRIHSSRTCYDWDGEGDDPNRALVLCDSCAKVHNEYWDEQWDEYYWNCM